MHYKMVCAMCFTNVIVKKIRFVRPGLPPGETEGQTSGETQGQTPGETSGQTPGETPGESTGQTPGEMPAQTQGETLGETPDQTSGETPAKPSDETPGQTSSETPGQTQGETPGQTTEETPAEIPFEIFEEEDDDVEEEPWIRCGNCRIFYHRRCTFLQRLKDPLLKEMFLCNQCRRRRFNQLSKDPKTPYIFKMEVTDINNALRLFRYRSLNPRKFIFSRALITREYTRSVDKIMQLFPQLSRGPQSLRQSMIQMYMPNHTMFELRTRYICSAK